MATEEQNFSLYFYLQHQFTAKHAHRYPLLFHTSTDFPKIRNLQNFKPHSRGGLEETKSNIFMCMPSHSFLATKEANQDERTP